MTAQQPAIVATSIGFRSMKLGECDWRLGPVYRYAADLAQAGPAPKVCIIATALGDHPGSVYAVYAAFGRAGYRASHLALYPQPDTPGIRELLLGQDMIWVAGGSVANLLAVCKVHDLAPVLRECWQAGVVLCGVSAGSVCWFTGGTTDSFGLPLREVRNGLGFLPCSDSPRHDAEEQRRPAITKRFPPACCPTRAPRRSGGTCAGSGPGRARQSGAVLNLAAVTEDQPGTEDDPAEEEKDSEERSENHSQGQRRYQPAEVLQGGSSHRATVSFQVPRQAAPCASHLLVLSLATSASPEAGALRAASRIACPAAGNSRRRPATGRW